jgi:hypothetical protein
LHGDRFFFIAFSRAFFRRKLMSYIYIHNALTLLLSDVEAACGEHAYGFPFEDEQHPFHQSVLQARDALTAVNEMPAKVKEALLHVKSVYPEVTQVFYGADQRWMYCGEAFSAPDFDLTKLNASLLEDAADSISFFPAAFALNEPYAVESKAGFEVIRKELAALYKGEKSNSDVTDAIAKLDPSALAEFIVEARERGWISNWNLGLDDEGSVI